MKLRDKVYAHNDRGAGRAGRAVRELNITFKGDIAHVEHLEDWVTLDPNLLDPIRELCTDQEQRLRPEAARIATAIRKQQDQAAAG